MRVWENCVILDGLVFILFEILKPLSLDSGDFKNPKYELGKFIPNFARKHVITSTIFFSSLYFTSIYNVRPEIYNSSINSMFTH